MADEFVKVVEYDKKGKERVDVYKLPTGAEQVEQLWEENKDLDDLYYALAEKIHDFPHFLKRVISEQKLFKFPMPEQDPKVRATNFEEVAKGYTPEMAIAEARRCLACKNPKCRTGCPVSVRIPEFKAKVAEGDFDMAYNIITSTNSLPAVCGRVCPQEKQIGRASCRERV